MSQIHHRSVPRRGGSRCLFVCSCKSARVYLVARLRSSPQPRIRYCFLTGGDVGDPLIPPPPKKKLNGCRKDH